MISLRNILAPLKRRIAGGPPVRRAVITQPVGLLHPGDGPATLVVAVGPAFNQNLPNAMMTARMGYCHGFEALGIPYLIVDVGDLRRTLDQVPNPIVFLVGYEYSLPCFDDQFIAALRGVPHFVWVNPWFKGSDRFFAEHDLDASVWDWTSAHRRRILDSQPTFAFTATVPMGLGFFEQWQAHGLRVLPLPLACDTSVYGPEAPARAEFEGVKLAFVGGYWQSKGRQIDRYLRAHEDDLTIYGYNRWPYRGYRGQLDSGTSGGEAALYRQAKVCPVINEPTVRLLHGQINERVFKVLGSGGVAAVDAMPPYRELFTADELPVPRDVEEFHELVNSLLADEAARRRWSRRGQAAVLARHTYVHRARTVLQTLGLGRLALGQFQQNKLAARPAA